MVCVAMPKKDRLTESLEQALEAARVAEEKAAEERRTLEGLLRQRGFTPEESEYRASRSTRGRAPKGRVSMPEAVLSALNDHGEVKLAELCELVFNQYGAHSDSSDKKNVLSTALRKMRDAGQITLSKGKYGLPME